VTKLLENEETLPRRYRTLAKLMEADIRPLKTDSLDEIARMMDDVRRRLELARAGKTVRMQEEQVVAKLEKLIEELEKQQQQQQQPGNGGGSQPSAPMQDSQAAQMRGAGEVDPKSLGKKDEWGNLPPKERQEVLQQIGRDLPAHFRETIEEYFKRLAQDGVR
jgi:TolA-binding protein